MHGFCVLDLARKRTGFAFSGIYDLQIYWVAIRGVYLTGTGYGQGERKGDIPARPPFKNMYMFK